MLNTSPLRANPGIDRPAQNSLSLCRRTCLPLSLRQPCAAEPLQPARQDAAQVAKCAWSTCAATRKALAATVKLGLMPVLEGKNEVSTT
jgi:hypothetical protein